MDDLLRQRIERMLDGLSDEQAYRVLDYVEFLQSKYGDRDRGPSALGRIADGVEDTLRVSRVPMAAIKGTREVFNTAERVMKGLADAGRVMMEGVQDQLKEYVPEDGKTDGAPVSGEGEGGGEEEGPRRDPEREARDPPAGG